jgi:hypothetical protein
MSPAFTLDAAKIERSFYFALPRKNMTPSSKSLNAMSLRESTLVLNTTDYFAT